MRFIYGYKPEFKEPGEAYWFLFKDDKILIQIKDGHPRILLLDESSVIKINPLYKQYFGKLDNFDCFAAECPAGFEEREDMSFTVLRKLFNELDDVFLQAAGLAYHIINWDLKNQYCGKCGSHNVNKPGERAKVCPECGNIVFPRISPAVIVAVVKDDKILLGRGSRSPTNFYSVIAGFVEPGETLEECLKREVKEETGIEVKNIRYFGSQPWPYPDSLMVGFTAEYAGGEIQIDGTEILDAAWFTVDRLPMIPGKISISRRLIDWYIENQLRSNKIRKITEETGMKESVRVIRSSFQTVVDEFKLTEENSPTNPAFITYEKIGELFKKGVNLFGLFEENRQVGFLALEKADEKAYYLEKLAIIPEFRHKGFGKSLLDFAFDFVKKQNGEKISIGIINENKILKNWYLNYGFVETGLKRFEHLPFTVCFMEKRAAFMA